MFSDKTIDISSLLLINAPPSGLDKTVNLIEDGTYIFSVSDFGFSDTDSNTLAVVKISSLATVGQLIYNGTAITATQISSAYEVSAADLSSGKLVYTPVGNGNGIAYSNFTFQVRDNGGTSNGAVDLDPTAKTITFNVTSVNDAPLGSDKTVTVAVNGSYAFILTDFGFSDVDGNSLSSVKIDSLPALGQLNYNGTALTSSQISAGYEITSSDVSSGKLMYAPVTGGSGSTYSSFSFQVRDNGGTSSGGIDLDSSANIITFDVTYNLIIGTSGNDNLKGTSGNDTITAGAGNDLITATLGTDTVDGGEGTDTIVLRGLANQYTITNNGLGKQTVIDNIQNRDGLTSINNVEKILFSDMSVNLTVNAIAASVTKAQLTSIEELYIAFFNRVPDADGLQFWIQAFNSGQTLNQIADNFYTIGSQYTNLTGYSSNMTNADFINIIYANVLGRTDGADAEGLVFWENCLSSGTLHGSLVEQILVAAHAYKGELYGWVADLLNNKVAVSHQFSVTMGLSYNDNITSITKCMAIASAITPTDTSAAIDLIGVSDSNIHLV